MPPIAASAERPTMRWLILVAAAAALLSAGWTVTAAGVVGSGASARDYYGEAQNLASRGHCELAIPLFTQAIARNHVYVAALQGRALCAQTLGADDVAIADLTTALRVDPTNYGLLLARAGAEIDDGATGRAQSDTLAALRLAPPQVPSYLSVADDLYAVADLTDAARTMTLALLLLPRDPTLYARRAVYEAAMYDYERAAADYQSAVGLAAPGARLALYDALATVQDQAQNYGAARRASAAAIALSPRDPALYVMAGAIEHDAGNEAAAVALYRRALAHGARGIDALRAWERSGDALATMGQTRQAIAAYRAAISVTPDRARRRELEAKIKGLGS